MAAFTTSLLKGGRKLFLNSSRNILLLSIRQSIRVRLISSYDHEHDTPHKFSYFHGASPHPFLMETIGQRMDQTAEKYPDRLAYVFCEKNTRASYAEFKHQVDELAAGFLSLGLKRGDRVAMWGPNIPEWIITQFATAKAGLILVNVNPAYRVEEAAYALNKVGCKAIVVSSMFKTSDYYEMLCKIAPEIPNSSPGELKSERLPELKIVITVEDDALQGTYTFKTVMKAGGAFEKKKLEDLKYLLQCDDPINIQFTSGTTGAPKGATLTHHGILNNAHFTGDILDYHKYTKLCVPVPLYHCFGMVLGSVSSLVYGGTVVYPSPGFDAGATLKAVSDESCNSLYGTPTMFIDMLNHPDFDKFDLTSLRTGIMAGSPCPIEIMRQVISRMHMPQITICYGLTECSPVTNQSHMDDPLELRVSTVGKGHPHNELKVIDEYGQLVPVDTPGELCVRGYNIMLGYWDDEGRTAEVIEPNGWFHTGDLATLDENGYCSIIGRIKDLVIRGGENIYPTEIEQFLYRHPKIQDVQVIGVPDERLGEELCAWIKLHANTEATEDEIKQFCHGKISHFKIPKYIKFTDDFPLTVTGKVKKFVMREISKKELGL